MQTAVVQKGLGSPGRREPPCNNESSEFQVGPQRLRWTGKSPSSGLLASLLSVGRLSNLRIDACESGPAGGRAGNWPELATRESGRELGDAARPKAEACPPWSPLSSCLRLRICLGPDGDREAPRPKLGPLSKAGPSFNLCDLAVVYFGCGLLLWSTGAHVRFRSSTA